MDLPRLAADAIFYVHAAYVAFVVLGLAAVLLGAALGWGWIRNFWFRATHLAAIGLVAAEALLGMFCPLTRWENHFRAQAGQSTHENSFVGYWLHELIFVDLPNEVLAVVHCAFALAVVAAFVWIPPRCPKWGRKESTPD